MGTITNWILPYTGLYCRCGYIDFAWQVFEKRGKQNVFSWNSMIVGSAANGHFEEALQLFEQMEIEPFKSDGVGFTGMLTACSHAGLVNEGVKYFSDMKNAHKITPRIKHYGCLVDLYSRSGKLEDSMNVIKEMPTAPNDVVLGSLLAACMIHEDVELAKVLTENLGHHSDSNHVMLSNIYGHGWKLGWCKQDQKVHEDSWDILNAWYKLGQDRKLIA